MTKLLSSLAVVSLVLFGAPLAGAEEAAEADVAAPAPAEEGTGSDTDEGSTDAEGEESPE